MIAIEPEAGNFVRLSELISEAGVVGVVDLIEAAAAEADGTVHLTKDPYNPANHRLSESGFPVVAVTLDGLLAARGWPDQPP